METCICREPVWVRVWELVGKLERLFRERCVGCGAERYSVRSRVGENAKSTIHE